MAKRKKEWPPWWEWEVKLIDHVYETMEKRDFTEIELRRMMEHASGYRRDNDVEGRWVIETRFKRQRWEVVVEPIPERKRLEVVTAYPRWED
jgi:hypothetical protein